MKALGLVAIAACASSTDGTGLVVIAEPTAGIGAIDVATGRVTELDPGAFGAIAVSLDGDQVAYLGGDLQPRINDLHGNIETLPSTQGCCAALTWWPGGAISYQIIGQPELIELVTAGGVARRLDTSTIAVSNDGTRVAYMDFLGGFGDVGDFVIEDLDGGNRAVLVPQVAINQLAFTPDDAGLTYAMFNPDNTTHVERLALADGTRLDLGTGSLSPDVPGGSRYSPDGGEMLVIEPSGHLVGHALADGAPHPYIVDHGVGEAAYIANGRVVATDFSGVLGAVPNITLTDGTDVRRLASTSASQCFVSQISRANEQIALTCSVPAIIDFSGELLVGRDASSSLGLSPDGAGMVTFGNDGLVELVSIRTGPRALATATATEDGSRIPPFAVYAPWAILAP